MKLFKEVFENQNQKHYEYRTVCLITTVLILVFVYYTVLIDDTHRDYIMLKMGIITSITSCATRSSVHITTCAYKRGNTVYHALVVGHPDVQSLCYVLVPLYD